MRTFCLRSLGHQDVPQKPKLCDYANITVLQNNEFPVASEEPELALLCHVELHFVRRGRGYKVLSLNLGDGVGNLRREDN